MPFRARKKAKQIFLTLITTGELGCNIPVFPDIWHSLFVLLNSSNMKLRAISLPKQLKEPEKIEDDNLSVLA